MDIANIHNDPLFLDFQYRTDGPVSRVRSGWKSAKYFRLPGLRWGAFSTISRAPILNRLWPVFGQF